MNGSRPSCDQTEGDTPKCVKKCDSGYPVEYKKDLHFGKKAYSVSSRVSQIQTELLTNGPIEAAFTVYEDFVNYKSGK